LQKGLRTPLKKANITIKGSTFNTDFTEHAIEDYFNTTKDLQREKTSACKSCLKRAKTLVDKKTFCKKPIPKCLICGIRGHSLQDY